MTGTPQDRTVAVANGGITDAHLAGGINPAKISGTAAIVNGPNTFTGPLEVAPNSSNFALRIDQTANGHGLLSYVNTTAGNKLVFSAASLAGVGFNVMGNGKVGIGTATPGAMLDVNGTANFTDAVTGNSFSGNGSGLTGVAASGLAAGTYSNAYTFNNAGNVFSGSFLSLGGNGIVGGNLGVGTATPSHKAEFVDASNTGLRVQTNSGGGTVASFGGFGAFQIDAPGVVGGRFTVSETGNVGVGTASPAAKLDVAGSLRIGGDTPMSSNPHMTFSGYFQGSFCGDFTCGCTGAPCLNDATFGNQPISYFVPTKGIAITRVNVALRNVIDPSCGSPAGIQIRGTNLSVSIPTNVSTFDSGPLFTTVPAGTGLSMFLVPATTHCTVGASGGGNAFINVEYVMQ